MMRQHELQTIRHNDRPENRVLANGCSGQLASGKSPSRLKCTKLYVCVKDSKASLFSPFIVGH